MPYRWEVLAKKSDCIIEQLLINRKIAEDEWSSFLNPRYEDLFDPFLLKNMRPAVERTKKAYIDKETIGIFADYDADGIPGAALLFDFFQRLALKTKVYIPTREEGYGLNRKGLDIFIKEKVNLLLAVDLGTNNQEEINYASKNGLDVIVLDHHEVGKNLEKAIFLNPKQKNETYPFRELSATGVVFKFIQAVNKSLKKIPENFLKWSLDLVAISTICDIVPLVSENRIFAKWGLKVLSKTYRPGLRELYKVSNIIPQNINTYSVGFQIGPRINAPGRLDHANESFYLLTTNKRTEAFSLAEKLDKANRRRQQELERVLKEAKEKVCRQGLNKKKIILVEGVSWPHGIIGLVAGKLMDEFARPVIVCERREKLLRGSARSIDALNIIEALEEAKAHLTKFGGHKKAAGLTLELEHLSSLYDKLLEIAESKLRDEDLIPKITVDAKVKIEDLKLSLVDKIKKIEPFGLGNPRPVFLLEKGEIHSIRTVGQKNKHLKFQIADLDVIGFDRGGLAKDLKDGQKIDLAFSIDEDSWDGRRKVQLKVLDIKF